MPSRDFYTDNKEKHMIDETPKTDFNALFAQCAAEYSERCRRRAEARPANKTVLFDALAAAGITRVIVNFDGCGDSGQIETIEARIHDDLVTLPEGLIEFIEHAGDPIESNLRMVTVEHAIEALVYDALQETCLGWEDNDGAYGDFTFDVETRTIGLDFNQRRMECDCSYHEF